MNLNYSRDFCDKEYRTGWLKGMAGIEGHRVILDEDECRVWNVQNATDAPALRLQTKTSWIRLADNEH